jgi:tetratricopeptide (TPR) repeat protein
MRHFEEALALSREIGFQEETVTALVGMAYTALVAGDLARAASLSDQAVVETGGLANGRRRADALEVLTWLAFHTDGADRGRALGEETLGMYRELGASGRVAEMLGLLGTVASADGRYDEASALLEECIALHRERGDEFRASVASSVRAHGALNRGDHVTAEELAERSLAVARRYEDRWATAMCLMLLEHVALAARGRRRRRRARHPQHGAHDGDRQPAVSLVVPRGPGRGGSGPGGVGPCRPDLRGAGGPPGATPLWARAPEREEVRGHRGGDWSGPRRGRVRGGLRGRGRHDGLPPTGGQSPEWDALGCPLPEM